MARGSRAAGARPAAPGGRAPGPPAARRDKNQPHMLQYSFAKAKPKGSSAAAHVRSSTTGAVCLAAAKAHAAAAAAGCRGVRSVMGKDAATCAPTLPRRSQGCS